MPFLCRYSNPVTTSLSDIKNTSANEEKSNSVSIKCTKSSRVVPFFPHQKEQSRSTNHDAVRLLTKSQKPGDISVAFYTVQNTGFLLKVSHWFGRFTFQLLDDNIAESSPRLRLHIVETEKIKKRSGKKIYFDRWQKKHSLNYSSGERRWR